MAKVLLVQIEKILRPSIVFPRTFTSKLDRVVRDCEKSGLWNVQEFYFRTLNCKRKQVKVSISLSVQFYLILLLAILANPSPDHW